MAFTLIKDEKFGGERPLFGIHHTRLENVEITDGESGIKMCHDLEANNCCFYGKYPWWHVNNSHITNCYFDAKSRSAIWYSNNMLMENCVIDGPKFFREMKHLELNNVRITDADETFWNVDNLKLSNVELNGGTYPFMGCKNILINNLISNSLYVFQYVKNVEIHNAQITTKDAFWEVENVTVYDSELNGEYLGWHSKNLKLIRCHISGEQPLCHAQNLVLDHCTFDSACDRAFEYSTVDAVIDGHIASIKNPTSGKIVVDSVGEVIIDQFVEQPNNCTIVVNNK